MKLSCKDVCFMVSESLDRTLSLRERVSVKIHLLMCKACRQMARQMTLLRNVSRQLEPKKNLSKEAGERILKQLRQTGQHHNKVSPSD